MYLSFALIISLFLPMLLFYESGKTQIHVSFVDFIFLKMSVSVNSSC